MNLQRTRRRLSVPLCILMLIDMFTIMVILTVIVVSCACWYVFKHAIILDDFTRTDALCVISTSMLLIVMIWGLGRAYYAV